MRTTGSAKIIADRPVITAKLTSTLPANKPPIYKKPCRQPNAAPTPASDKTPGPGVKNIKKDTIAKASIEQILIDFENHSIKRTQYSNNFVDTELARSIRMALRAGYADALRQKWMTAQCISSDNWIGPESFGYFPRYGL